MNEYFTLVVNGCATGFGAAVGTYFGQKHLIKNYEKIMEKIKKKED